MRGCQRLALATAACLGVLGVAGRARAEALINPKAVSWGANRLDVFAMGASTGALYHKAWDGSRWWPAQDGPWEPLGGATHDAPTVVSWGPNRLDIFIVGTDGALYHKAWEGANWYPSQSGWEWLGGALVGYPSPTAVSWGPNRLDIFALGTDHALYHKAWDGSGWHPSVSNWEGLGSGITGSPAVATWGPNRLDVFAVGLDTGVLLHKSWNGANWYPRASVSPNRGPVVSTWENLGGKIMGSPTVTSWGPNRLDLFAMGTDRALYHKAWEGANWYPSQDGYEWLGGSIDVPTVVSWGANRLDIFALGGDHALYHKAWEGADWYPSPVNWEWLGGIVGPPTAVSWGANRLDIFAAGTDGAVYHKAWEGADWYPSVSNWERLGDSSAHVPPATTPAPPTTPPPTTTPTRPPTPSITVSRQGAAFTVAGSGFLPAHQILIRVVDPATFASNYYNSTSDSAGKLNFPVAPPCPYSGQLAFSASDSRSVPTSQDYTGMLWSNTVSVACS